MIEKTIRIPHRLALAEDVYQLRLDYLDLSKIDVCNFDFRSCSFGVPMPMLLLANKIKYLARKFCDCRFKLYAGNDPFHTFADHIGLFRYMGWPRGREPGEAWGSSGYVPVEVFNVAEFRRRAVGGPVGRLINEESNRLALVLAQREEGALFDVLQYSIREVVRNSLEHSRGTSAAILAQYWPKKESAEIVIIDDGIGIPSNLYENEMLQCDDAREALKFALLPGITGVPLKDRLKQDDYWVNSGFGLYVTSRICSENGSFRIISDTQGLTLTNGVQIEHSWHLNGTCVQMNLITRSVASISKRIPQIVEEGESQKERLFQEYPIRASAASKMLASQFRKKIFNKQ